MHFFKWQALILCAALCLSLCVGLQPTIAADADTAAETKEPAASEVAASDQAVADLIAENTWHQVNLDSGANAWMLVSCALVLMMTAPGLALFYSGLVRKKNVLGVMMQCLFLMGMMTVLWGVCGFSLCFGGDGAEQPWIGNGEYFFMANVQPVAEKKPVLDDTGKPVLTSDNKLQYEVELDENGNEKMDAEGQPVYVYEPRYPMEDSGIPRLTFMLFQGMFFIITPALICGAFAERMKFGSMVVFSLLWGLLVYCPLCHWVWDGGILAHGEGTGALPFCGALDFAGGTVVHISSGVSALVCAVVIGKRLGFGSEPMPPHNLTYTVTGAAMLWVGWFGFNAGSALAANGAAASAFCATHFAAAAGALGWAGIEWILRKKPTVLGAASGAVAGLVCITPAAGFVQPMPAILMGLLGGIVCFAACTTLKRKFGYDDSLDAFGVHGVGGTLGAVLTGIFATNAVTGGSDPLGLIDGGTVIINQVLATVITMVFAAGVTLALLKAIDSTIGLRVSQEEEVQGLDLSQHGEEGYIFI